METGLRQDATLGNQVEYLFVLAECSPNQPETHRKAFYHYGRQIAVSKCNDTPAPNRGFSLSIMPEGFFFNVNEN